jgi:PIN domain
MAQVPEIDMGRALMLDANIMLRGVLGTRVRTLIERYANDVSLLTPQSCVDEVEVALEPLIAPRIARRTGLSINACAPLSPTEPQRPHDPFRQRWRQYR